MTQKKVKEKKAKADSKLLKKPLLVILSAPSGAGKTTLCRRLLNDFKSLELSISTTTRAPRGQEKHGIEYWFTTKQDFEAQIQADRFAEWARVHDYYYGTSKKVIEDAARNHKAVLLDIDVQGAALLKKAYPENCLLIFVSPPSLEILEQRLRARGTDSEETILKRLKNAQKEMDASQFFDFTLVNDQLERTYQELKNLIASYLHSNHDKTS